MFSVDEVDEAPVVVFTKAPSKTNASPLIEWKSSESANFDCLLDNPPYFPCGRGTMNSWTRKNVADGQHTFKVRATDNEGNVGEPAVHIWTVGKINAPALHDSI